MNVIDLIVKGFARLAVYAGSDEYRKKMKRLGW